MPIGLIFPGQGSQHPGMGVPWRQRASWEVVDRISEQAGRDVVGLLLTADEPTLRRTDNAQLAIFALEMVILAELERTRLVWSACAGHSLGEYAALVAAGIVGIDDAARLVAARGSAMAAAARAQDGTMCVLLCAEDIATELVAQAQREGHDVWVANLNAPAQVVATGTATGIAEVTTRATAAGLRVTSIPVGGAFHSPLMEPAVAPVRAAWDGVTTATGQVPVVANVDALAHDGSTGWARRAAAQIVRPVRWTESVRTLADTLGCDRLIEVGPGSVLSGLVRKTCPGVRRGRVNVADDLPVQRGATRTVSRGSG